MPAIGWPWSKPTCSTMRGWSAAVEGCRYVLHPASPLGGGSEESLIATARDGALRVLRAAVDAGVDRMVLTSAAERGEPGVVPRARCHR